MELGPTTAPQPNAGGSRPNPLHIKRALGVIRDENVRQRLEALLEAHDNDTHPIKASFKPGNNGPHYFHMHRAKLSPSSKTPGELKNDQAAIPELGLNGLTPEMKDLHRLHPNIAVDTLLGLQAKLAELGPVSTANFFELVKNPNKPGHDKMIQALESLQPREKQVALKHAFDKHEPNPAAVKEDVATVMEAWREVNMKNGVKKPASTTNTSPPNKGKKQLTAELFPDAPTMS